MSALYPYQEAGVNFLLHNPRALLLDEMGLGKTVQVLTALQRMQPSPKYTLVVCPSVAVQYVWQAEVAKWWPEARVSVIQGAYADRMAAWSAAADIYVVNSRVMWLDRDEAPLDWDVIVLDEAHMYKNRKSQQYRELKPFCKRASRLYMLTGSASRRQPDDMWALLHLLNPQRFRSYWKFVRLFCKCYYNGFGWTVGEVNDPEAFAQTLDPFTLRRSLADVRSDLPAKTIQYIFLDMTPDQRQAYETMREYCMTLLGDDLVVAQNVVSQLTFMKQLAIDPLLLTADNDCPLAGPKMHAALELIQSADDTDSWVIFSQYKRVVVRAAATLRLHGHDPILITGGMTKNEMANAVEAFQTRKNRILLATMQAGGTGLTLTAAHRAIFMDRMWVPDADAQAEARLHRTTQEYPVTIYRLLMNNSIEARINHLLQTRADHANDIYQRLARLSRESLDLWTQLLQEEEPTTS